MKKNNATAILEMLHRLKDFTQKNSTILHHLLPPRKPFHQFDQLWLQYNKWKSARTKMEMHRSLYKWEKKENLAAVLSIVLGNLAQYAFRTQQSIVPGHLYHSEKTLVRTDSDSLINICNKAIELCENKGDELPISGVSKELFDLLLSAQKEYQEIAQQERINKNRKKVIAQKLEKISRQILDLLDRELDPIMKQCLSSTHTDLYQSYLNARRIPSYAHRKTSVEGRVMDAYTHKPIHNVRIEIPKVNRTFLSKGVHGAFRIRNLDPDKYDIQFTHPDFDSTTLNLNYQWGESHYLEVQLYPTKQSIRKKIKQVNRNLVSAEY